MTTGAGLAPAGPAPPSLEDEVTEETRGQCQGDSARCPRAGLEGCPEGHLGKPDRKGLQRIRGCNDPSARGRRNRRAGKAQQNRARNALGVAADHGSRDEETWSDDTWVTEVKSGAQVKPVLTAWQRITSQIEAARKPGDERLPRAVIMPAGSSAPTPETAVVVVSLASWEQLIRPALERGEG